MEKKYIVVLQLLSVLLCSWGALCDIEQKTEIFPKPPGLKKQVDFWTKVYSFYDSNQVIFYDQKEPDIIYAVLDLPRIEGEISSPRYRPQVQKKFDAIQSMLETIELNQKMTLLSDEALRIQKILKSKKIDLTDLKTRLRSQNGLKSQFALGLKNSGRYINDMKSILKAQSLPEELIALVFVESLFFLSATSHAGASGPWGIMKETALSMGIHVNNFVDERLDPLISTWAAAHYLKKSYAGLGEWPVAITSYNYGYPGTLRAVTNLDTRNLEEIIAKHESPIFGYASKNYYAEFLAAHSILSQRELYFPELELSKPWRYEIVQVQRAVEIADIIKTRALSSDELKQLNPSLSPRTLRSEEVLPPRYALRVPEGKSKHFYAMLKKIPAAKRKAAESKISTKYKSNGKESLAKIAKKNGVDQDFLAKKFNETLLYQPKKGVINIRSQSYLFSPLKQMSEIIVANK